MERTTLLFWPLLILTQMMRFDGNWRQTNVIGCVFPKYRHCDQNTYQETQHPISLSHTLPNMTVRKHEHFSFLTQVREHNPPTPNRQYSFWWTLRLKGGIQFNEIILYTILYNCFYTWYDTHDIIINIPYFKISATLKSLLLVITSISWLVIFSPISNLANPLSAISIITKDLTWICWGAYA